jgi:hypothetical protein
MCICMCICIYIYVSNVIPKYNLHTIYVSSKCHLYKYPLTIIYITIYNDV